MDTVVHNTSIVNNTIEANGTNQFTLIRMSTTVDDNLIDNNALFGIAAASPSGITLLSANRNNFTNNFISIVGNANHRAFLLSSSQFSLISNNVIRVNASGLSAGTGVFLSGGSHNSTFVNNDILLEGAFSAIGIQVGSDANVVANNTVRANSSFAFGVTK